MLCPQVKTRFARILRTCNTIRRLLRRRHAYFPITPIFLGAAAVIICLLPYKRYKTAWETSCVYEDEAWPILQGQQHRIELYEQLNNETLPGNWGTNTGFSQVQTFAHGIPVLLDGGCETWHPVAAAHHYFFDIFGHTDELTGDYIAPDHIQYRIERTGKPRSVFALGAFGNGTTNFLPCGTGIALLEIVDAEARTVRTAYWFRTRPVKNAATPVVLANARETASTRLGFTPAQAAHLNICWTGDAEALVSGDPERVSRAEADLRKAGWSAFKAKSSLVMSFP